MALIFLLDVDGIIMSLKEQRVSEGVFLWMVSSNFKQA